MSAALPAVRDQRAFSLTDMRDMADALAASKLFGIQTPVQAYALMLIADAEGLHPASVAQDYDVIQGRPARKTHSVLARFQQAGGSVQWHDFTETVVSGTFSHPRGGSVKIEWTIEMAARAGLAGKDNWKKTPRAMLRARCIAEGVRATFPAALGGALLTEEAQDLDVVAVQGDPSQGLPTAARVDMPKAKSESVTIDQPKSAESDAERSKPTPERKTPPPASTSDDDRPATDGEKANIRLKLKGEDISEEEFAQRTGLSLDSITLHGFREARRFLADPTSYAKPETVSADV